jgi:hypothetical protein
MRFGTERFAALTAAPSCDVGGMADAVAWLLSGTPAETV